jgi:hypothetical protein
MKASTGRFRQSSHAMRVPDALVWSMPVVGMDPALEHRGPIGGAPISYGVSPLPQRGLVKGSALMHLVDRERGY